MSEFDGTVAIVTGGASGIGLATAKSLVAAGASVAVLDLNLDGLPPELTGFVADVSDRASSSTTPASALSELSKRTTTPSGRAS
jgi:NAD(P)-dependent dehydrogenase (short-subunit alcohol dehydrogenase family)